MSFINSLVVRQEHVEDNSEFINANKTEIDANKTEIDANKLATFGKTEITGSLRINYKERYSGSSSIELYSMGGTYNLDEMINTIVDTFHRFIAKIVGSYSITTTSNFNGETLTMQTTHTGSNDISKTSIDVIELDSITIKKFLNIEAFRFSKSGQVFTMTPLNINPTPQTIEDKVYLTILRRINNIKTPVKSVSKSSLLTQTLT